MPKPEKMDQKEQKSGRRNFPKTVTQLMCRKIPSLWMPIPQVGWTKNQPKSSSAAGVHDGNHFWAPGKLGLVDVEHEDLFAAKIA